MTNCIFCKIIANELPHFVIHEDENYLAFLDLAQFTDGHTVVVPKKHIQFLWDNENIGEYLNFCKEVANHYKHKLGFKYVDTLTFGRMIPHSHIHLVPHNGDNKRWGEALKGIHKLQLDKTFHPEFSSLYNTQLKFKLQKK